MGFYGMDSEAVEGFGRDLADVAGQVRELESRLTSRIAAVEWNGTDRERFEGDWQAQHVRALREAAEVLDLASQTALEQAREQEGASR